jgi:glycosyltransferase involved in cell wall biosynthesis
MITVGRIGSEQKATDVLCEAFKLFIEKDDTWRLEIVGPIDLKFESYITDLFIQNPDLRDRIKFLGNIESKQELAKKYESAKIFVLPSRWEGFALVYLEAIRAGCYMLCSDILPAHDVTDYQTYGKLFPVDDYRNLANLMTVVTSEGFLNNEMCLAIQAHAYRNYYWPSIVNNIHGLIKEAS